MKKVFISEKAIPSNPRSKNYSTGSTIIRTSSGTNNSLLPAQEQLFIKKLDPFGNPYAYTDLPIVTRCGLITYNDDGSINLPDLYAGLPLDGTTIGRDASGALTVLGGVGSDFDVTQMWASLSVSGAEQINKSHLTDALAGYARTSDIPSLSGYATESWVNDKGYVTTTRLNELIGGASSAFDTLKEIEDYINSHESVTAGLIASLGNKVDKVTGMGLSEHSFTTSLRDKLNSIAEGANKYILPVAKAAVLGGVMIGSNINVNAQGVISVEAPYSHPTQQVITTGAARHFLTGLSVNEYGHVTSATSAALTKDDLLSVLKDKDGVIRLDAQLALTGSLINFANLGTVNIPSLYDGIPVDGKSIYWENGTLKSSSTGGGGLAKVIVKVGLAAYESVDGVVTLPAYPTMPDLTNYVTTNTPQTIQGQKTFVSDQIFATGAYFGTNKKGTLHADGSITAEIFRKTGGIASQFLKADGSVDSTNYIVYNTAINADTETRAVGYGYAVNGWLLSGPAISFGSTNGYLAQIQANADSVDGELYFRHKTPNVTRPWKAIAFKDWVSNYHVTTNTEQVISGKKIYSTDQYYNNNIGIVTIDGQGLLFSDGTRTITGDATRPHRIRSNDSNLEHWRNGVGRYDILDGYNWRSIVDGRYLPLTGGLLTGPLTANQDIKAGHMGWKAQLSSSSNTNEVLFGLALPDNSNNAYIRLGMNKIEYFNGANNTIWHAGNDGTGSGLDADTLDGKHLSEVLNSNITPLGNIQSGTVLECKNTLVNLFNSKASHGIGANVTIGTSFIEKWSDDAFTFYPSSVYSMIKIGGGYTDMQYGQFLLSSYNLTRLGVVGRNSNNWSEIKWLAFTTDNVASATKLQTSRLIYGQNFDGTSNISGALSDVRSITSLINLPIDYVSQQGQYFYTNNNQVTPLLILKDNVGIGTVNPVHKLHVVGDIYASSDIWTSGHVNASRVFAGYDSGVTGSMSCSNWFRSNGATGWYNQTYNGGMYMDDSDHVRVYNNKVLYNDGFRQWGIGGHKCGLKLYADDNIGINLANSTYTWGIYANNDGNMYIGRRSGNVNDSSGSYYLIIGAGTMTYNGSIVLNGGGLITYSSDIRLKEIQEYFKPSLSELAALPIFAHSWRNGTPGVQLSTSAQAVQKIMPWNVFEGSDGYLKMDGTRTALAVSIRLAQLANEYITENERWKSDKDRQIEELQREVQSLKQKLNAA